MDSINYLCRELGVEFEIIALTDGDKLNFDKSFLHFNVKKKVTLNSTVNIEY